MKDGLQFERCGNLAILTLSRPEAGNAIDLPMAQAINRAAATCDLDDDIRCVVLRGAGRMFCGGGDVRAFAAAGGSAPALIQDMTANLHLGISRLARMEKPLITAINGSAGGAGLSLACLGDIAVAARSGKFTSGYTALGLAPDGGLSWLLPRLAGLRRAQELILTNRRFSADEGVAMGIFTTAVEDDQLDAHVNAVAETLLASTSNQAVGVVKRLLLAGCNASLESHLELEAREITKLAGRAKVLLNLASFTGNAQGRRA